MSQPLAGMFGWLGAKSKDGARRRRKPGPEWHDPLRMSKVAIAFSGTGVALETLFAIKNSSLTDMAGAIWQGYCLITSIRNYQVTRQSANEAPLRELLGDRAPANDNLLTPRQSLSNSYTLGGRIAYGASAAFGAHAVLHMWAGTFDAATSNTLFSGVAYGIGRLDVNSSSTYGPTRMPNLLGNLPKAP